MLKKVLIILGVLLLSIAGFFYYHIEKMERIEQAEREAQAKQDAKDLEPFSGDVNTFPIASGIADGVNVLALNEALVEPEVEIAIVTDLPTAELYIGLQGQSTSQYEKRFFQRSIFYDSAMNFSRVPDLQAVHYYFDDQVITITRTAFAEVLGDAQIESLTDTKVWETEIVGKLLDINFMNEFMTNTAAVQKGGLKPLALIETMPEMLLYLKMELGVEKTNLEQLPFEIVKPILFEVDQVFQLYPELDGYITTIEVTDQIDPERFMELQPAFDFKSASIRLNSRWYSEMDKLEENWELGVETEFYPEGTESETIVVHELTHGLEAYIIGTRYQDSPAQEQIDAWENSTVSKEIISSAYAKVSPVLVPGTSEDAAVEDISEYAATGGPSEALAEAAHDVYDNGKRADAMSKAMVEELNTMLTSVSGEKHQLMLE